MSYNTAQALELLASCDCSVLLPDSVLLRLPMSSPPHCQLLMASFPHLHPLCSWEGLRDFPWSSKSWTSCTPYQKTCALLQLWVASHLLHQSALGPGLCSFRHWPIWCLCFTFCSFTLNLTVSTTLPHLLESGSLHETHKPTVPLVPWGHIFIHIHCNGVVPVWFFACEAFFSLAPIVTQHWYVAVGGDVRGVKWALRATQS